MFGVMSIYCGYDYRFFWQVQLCFVLNESTVGTFKVFLASSSKIGINIHRRRLEGELNIASDVPANGHGIVRKEWTCPANALYGYISGDLGVK